MLGLLAVSMIGHAAQQDENKRADKVEVILVASKPTGRGIEDFISQTTLTLRNN